MIFLVILVLIIVFIGIRWILKSPPEIVAKLLRKTGLLLLIFVILVAVALGKLNWLFAVVGVTIAFIARLIPIILARLIPIILGYAPAIQRLWFNYKAGQRGAGHNQNNQTHSRTNQSNMTVEQAYQVLGLTPGAPREDIIKAHKRLMMKVHPDKGGSDFLAAQLNRAKNRLLQ